MTEPVQRAEYVRAEADRWAAEFIERFRGRVVGDTVTKELLATWFANAMTAGREGALFEIDSFIEWADADPTTRDVGVVEKLREMREHG